MDPVQRLRERLAAEYARLSRLEEELAGLRRVLERAELEVHAQQIRIGHTERAIARSDAVQSEEEAWPSWGE